MAAAASCLDISWMWATIYYRILSPLHLSRPFVVGRASLRASANRKKHSAPVWQRYMELIQGQAALDCQIYLYWYKSNGWSDTQLVLSCRMTHACGLTDYLTIGIIKSFDHSHCFAVPRSYWTKYHWGTVLLAKLIANRSTFSQLLSHKSWWRYSQLLNSAKSCQVRITQGQEADTILLAIIFLLYSMNKDPGLIGPASKKSCWTSHIKLRVLSTAATPIHSWDLTITKTQDHQVWSRWERVVRITWFLRNLGSICTCQRPSFQAVKISQVSNLKSEYYLLIPIANV